jgi:predicted permease
MSDLRSTVRFAVRFLRARPLFTSISVGSLAIGIGATTAIFSVVNALLIRTPPGIGDPDRVVELGRTDDGSGFDTFSYPDFEDYRDQIESLDELAGWTIAQVSWSTESDAERLLGFVVSAAYFDALGVLPARGRTFAPAEDDGLGAHPVVVISDRFWRERLRADENIIGSTISLNRVPMTVVGVTPPEFRGHMALFEPSVYVPMSMATILVPGVAAEDFENRNAHWFLAIGRLAEGAAPETAAAAADVVARRIQTSSPELTRNEGVAVLPLGMVPGTGRALATGFLVAILVLVGVVLLVTCTNVAGMLLARGASRQKEIGIRLALGSSRHRLILELLTETLTLFVVGGALGIVLAVAGVRALEGVSLPTPIPVTLRFAPDLRVLGFGLGLALVTGLAFGLAPAFLSTRLDLVPALKESSSSGRTHGFRLRRVFVAGQIAMSLVLLFGSGLFLRALHKASRIDAGFEPGRVQMTTLGLELDGYDEERGRILQQRLLEIARALPGVETAALSVDLPQDLESRGSAVYPEEWAGDAESDRGLGSDFNVVSEGYLETLRIRVLRGRVFREGDRRATEPVAIVSRALADLVWPDRSPIGRRIRFGEESAELRTVVGVVEDTPNQMVTDQPSPMVYLPLDQRYEAGVHLLVRGTSDAPLAGPIRAAVRDVDPRLTLAPVVPLRSRTALGLLPQRIAAGATTVLAVLALALSALGVHGVLAYAAAERTREMGIRIAVGARAGQVAWLILRQGLRLAVPGILLGVPLALAVGRLLDSFLLGGRVADPVALAAVAGALLAATATASWMPARRAARVDPARSLRVD